MANEHDNPECLCAYNIVSKDRKQNCSVNAKTHNYSLISIPFSHYVKSKREIQ